MKGVLPRLLWLALVLSIVLPACSMVRWGAGSADLGIIDEDPQAFLLTPEDLPSEAAYFLPGSRYSGAYHNTQVLAGWGPERGQDYLERTGRLDGYWADYVRGGEVAGIPQEIFCNIVKFETAQGAQLSLHEYNLVVMDIPENVKWGFVDRPAIDLGDSNIILETQEVQPEGEAMSWYRIEFSYKNFVAVVAGWGREEEIQHEFIEAAARKVLAKLEQAPVINP